MSRAGTRLIKTTDRLLSGSGYIDQLYRQTQAQIPLTENERNILNNSLLKLCHEQHWISKLYRNGVPTFIISSPDFREKFIRDADNDPDIRKSIRGSLLSGITNLHMPSHEEHKDNDVLELLCETITPHLTKYMEREMPRTMLAFHGAKHLADLTKPLDTFPSRPFRRRVVAHLGPPNSGKTYEAHQRLSSSPSGAYCAPLRLLAWEMHQRLNEQGISCSLLTGQDVRVSDSDTHLSSTVEMTPLHRDYACAVIDEMQMVGDSNRGYAWTRAFLGIRAPEVHICGSTSCYTMAKALADMAGDMLEVKEHARLGTVTIIEEPIQIADLQPGDCVVCFSRNTALRLVEAIERSCFNNNGELQQSTAVVYGSLPPETRTQQIADFNSRRKQVLVASDVIGMGVNVRIKRIIFHTLSKFDGRSHRMLTAAEVQQIAGRAGRYSLDCGSGFVGCIREDDLRHLKRLMRQHQDQLERAVVAPTPETLAAFVDTVRSATEPQATLAESIKIYRYMAQYGGLFEVFDVQALVNVARALAHVELPTRDLVEYLFVPLGSQPALKLVLRTFAVSHAVLNNVKLRNVLHNDALDLMENIATQPNGKNIQDYLRRMEMIYQILDAYVWLGNKFLNVYVDLHAAATVKTNLAKVLHEQLERSIGARESYYKECDEEEHVMEAIIARQLIRSHHFAE
ncbi:putative DExH-box ATP-dependent RNA helicase [Babesia sp. Xinjiang]|uniref:putative DExH-box ATP-dependent RNA helicase n=1 Tax=Babesia sp. Xinjiang TaxID=462227 RepID=UPI000A25FDB7|nr:putative DExH-box ATP-dependent RNA helicase [Babesia sp. Xinjiang]ORM39492.1 putative DExH-box ATP-dependent RNA helicase [Babesia sp. Xinjiang]